MPPARQCPQLWSIIDRVATGRNPEVLRPLAAAQVPSTSSAKATTRFGRAASTTAQLPHQRRGALQPAADVAETASLCVFDEYLRHPGSTNGQVQYVVALAQVLTGVPAGKVIGAFWWALNTSIWTVSTLADGRTGPFLRRRPPSASGGGLRQLAAPLVLSVSLTDAGLRLSWPLSGAGSSLRVATNLPPPLWLPVTNPVQTTGTSSARP